jgi:hypothetical protein
MKLIKTFNKKKKKMANSKKPKDPKSVGSTRLINMKTIEEPQPKWRPIDWNKVSTVKDVKAILSHMGLGCSEDAPAFVELEKYLIND